MIERKYNGDAVVICSSCDDNYVPYLYVALKSLITHASMDINYDILVFMFNMNVENRKILEELSRDNISVRVFKLVDEISIDMEKLVTRKLTKEIWLKSLLCYALPAYDKAIVMDCDVVFLDDVSKLYSIDIGNKYFGAVKFLNHYIYKFSKLHNARYYRMLEHGIDMKDDYFNYGVVLQNLKQFRNDISLNDYLEMIQKQNYLVQDQDLLNVISKGKAEWIDARWNTYPFKQEEFNNIIKFVPKNEREYWIKAYENPACIHYTTPIKPWKETKGRYSMAAKFFWSYVYQCPKVIIDRIEAVREKYEAERNIINSTAQKSWERFESIACDKQIYVYGYGVRGKELTQKLSQFNIKAYIDSDEYKRSTFSNVISIDEISSKESIVVISNDRWDPIAIELTNRGFENIFSYACMEKKDNRFWAAKEKDSMKIVKAYSLLADNESKELFKQILDKREENSYFRTTKYLDIMEKKQYFDSDKICLGENEKYLDIDNVTSKGELDYFIRYAKAVFRSAESVENVEEYDIDRFGPTLIRINSSKNRDIIEKISKYIKQSKPKMMIKLDENYDDLWEIPIILSQLDDKFILVLGHHDSSMNDTVLYAYSN